MKPAIKIIGHLRALRLRPGDKLVLFTEYELSEETVERFHKTLEAWTKRAGIETQCIVLGGGMKLGVLRPGTSEPSKC